MRQNTAAINPPQATAFTSRKLSRQMYTQGFLLIGALLAAAFVHYRMPSLTSIVLQVIILALYFQSKKNYPWLFVLFFVTFSPGSLYSNKARELFLIESSAFGIVTFQMMFILVTWLKLFTRKLKPVFYDRRYLLFFAYILFLMVLFGGRPVSLIRGLIFFSWLIAVPRLLNSSDEIDKLFFLIFMANILVLLANVFRISTGNELLGFFASFAQRRYFDTEELIRTAEGIQFAHLSVLGGLYYLSREKKPISATLAYSGLSLGLINILFSATRGWILSTLLLIGGYSFIMLPQLFRKIIILIPALTLTAAAVWQVPLVRTQMIRAYERVLYFENILNPDLDVETSDIGRVVRSGKVMDKFYESPWVGHGMSESVKPFTDSHTGNPSLLVNFGVIGYLLLLNLWLWFCFKLVSADRILRPRNPDHKLNILIAFGFLSVFVIHSTSGAFLHPFIGFMSIIWWGTIFALGNFLFYQQKGVFA